MRSLGWTPTPPGDSESNRWMTSRIPISSDPIARRRPLHVGGAVTRTPSGGTVTSQRSAGSSMSAAARLATVRVVAGTFISRLAGGLTHLVLKPFARPLILEVLEDAGGDTGFARALVRRRLEHGLGYFSRQIHERALEALAPPPVTSDGMHGAGSPPAPSGVD